MIARARGAAARRPLDAHGLRHRAALGRRRERRAVLATLAFALALTSCAPRRPGDWMRVEEVAPPFLDTLAAGAGALAADASGRVAMTFVTPSGAGADAWIAVSPDSGAHFSDLLRLNTTPGTAVADAETRPVAVFGPAGEVAVAWTERRPDSTEALDVAVRSSADGGDTFGAAVYPARDSNAGTGGDACPALVFRPDGSLVAVWTRRLEAHPGSDSGLGVLLHAMSGDGGATWSAARTLRDSMCACCRPAAAIDAAGRVAIAYRRLRDGAPDPALLLSGSDGEFVIDTLIANDGWRASGCPGEGPALALSGPSGGLMAWFAGGAEPRVFGVPWRFERGSTGLRRVLAGTALIAPAHPRLAAAGGSILIGVEARPPVAAGRTVFAVRALGANGSLTRWDYLGADVADAWLAAAGPRTAWACWTEREEGRSRLRAVRLRAF